jgi:hypothetical protein
MSTFDPMVYLPAPRFGLAAGISLTHGLHAAVPPNATETAVRYISEAMTKANLLNTTWAAREKAEGERPPSETRPADARMDIAVRALFDRLSAAAQLPPERYPEAAQAASLVASLFPEGLGWLRLPYDKEWSHANKLLTRIDSEGHAAAIDGIAGPAYLAELRLAFAEYGKVLGKTQARPGAAAQISVADGLKELSSLIGAYTLQILATADESKPETIDAVRHALQPLADYKATQSRAHTPEPETEEEEKTPVNLGTPI